MTPNPMCPHRGVLALGVLMGLVWLGSGRADETLPRGDCGQPMPRSDLRHCDFAGAVLTGRDLSGVRLAGARFPNPRVQGADFSGALDIPEHLAEMLAAP